MPCLELGTGAAGCESSVSISALERFHNDTLAVQHLARVAKETLLTYCEREGFAFLGRVKQVDSVAEKIETGRFARWSEIDDLYACTITVPTLAREGAVIDFCAAAFDIEVKRRGVANKSPDLFRFDLTRISANVRSSVPQSQVISSRSARFEIQVRSAFEHAWSVATHGLVYKTSNLDWRRRRIAAQIKASVEQLDSLLLAFDAVADAIDQNPYRELAEQVLVARTFSNWLTAGSIRQDMMPKDMSRFAENFINLLSRATRAPKPHEGLLIIDEYLKTKPTDRMPRSLSLLQFCMGVLAQEGFLSGPFKRYSANLTDELFTLYPSTGELGPAFDYDS